MFKVQMFMLAVTLIVLIGVHADTNADENAEVAQEQARACVDVYNECWYPTKPCCKNRPCKCNFAMTDCRCKKTLGELFG